MLVGLSPGKQPAKIIALEPLVILRSPALSIIHTRMVTAPEGAVVARGGWSHLGPLICPSGLIREARFVYHLQTAV